MIDTLDRLAQYIRQNIPEPKAIGTLSVFEQSGFVRFQWHAVEFVVKKSLEVFEIKGQNLFVSGASMLMQLALMKTEKNERVLLAVLDSLHQAEGMLGDEKQTQTALQLLSGVKATLRKLAPGLAALDRTMPVHGTPPSRSSVIA